MKSEYKSVSVHSFRVRRLKKVKTPDGPAVEIGMEILRTFYGGKRERARLIRRELPGFLKEGAMGIVSLDDARESESGFDTHSSTGFWSDTLDIGPGGIPIRWPPATGPATPPGEAPGDPPAGTAPEPADPANPDPGPGAPGGSMPGPTPDEPGSSPGDPDEPLTPGQELMLRACKGQEACEEAVREQWGVPKPGPDDGGGGHTGGPPADTGGTETGDTGNFTAF